MRNKIFILTEDLNFFYRLNKELNSLKFGFKILNIGNKIPDLHSLILTTSEEIEKIENPNHQKVKILSYAKNDNFEKYILKIIAAHRIGYKENYSELTFSIDPGIKHIGLIVFLDDYYLNSHTFFERNALIKKIKDYIDYFQKNNPDLMNLNFKFGRGVLLTTMDLIKEIYMIFNKRERIKVLLIDESKSSKIKIHNKESRISKHEASALILALREGIEVNQTNNLNNFNWIKSKKLKNNEYKWEEFEEIKEFFSTLGEIAEKVLNGEISLSESSKLIKEYKKIN